MGTRGTRGDITNVVINEKYIQAHLHNFLSNPRFILENLYVFGWESDLLLLTKSGYWYEFEIKISRHDFKHDFQKKEKHAALQDETVVQKPNYFYYAVPEGLIELQEIPAYAGLVYIRQGYFRTVKKAPRLHKGKNRAEDLNLVDKFYYNMKEAIHQKRELQQENKNLTEPFMHGRTDGIKTCLEKVVIVYSKACPNMKKGEYENLCMLKNRLCNRDCEYIADFIENIEKLL